MPAQTRRDLFLQVSADVTPLTAASKAGRSALLELGTASDDVAALVEKNFANLGGGGIAAGAKAIEKSFDQTFATIRRNAAEIMNMPAGKGALQILDANGAEQSARAAESQAAALRMNADAAAVLAQRAGETGSAEKVLAVSFETAARSAEQQALAMRSQANVMGALATEVRARGGIEVAANDEVTRSHGRMNIASMEAEHVVRSLSDSVAAGQSPMRALSMEMGRITEATTLWAQTTENTHGKIGQLASFMGGPWGLAISVGVAVLGPLIAGLVEGGQAAEDEGAKLKKNAEDTHTADIAKVAFGRTQDGLIASTRELTKELDKQNEALRSNAENKNIAAREDLAAQNAQRPDAVKNVADARGSLAAARATALQSPDATSSAAFIDAATQKLDAAVANLATLDKGIADASVAYQRTRIPLAAEQAKRDADPDARINALYNERIRLARVAAEDAAKEGREIGAATKAKLSGIEAERKAALAAEAERKAAAARATRDDQQSGRKIDLGQAVDIVHGIGGTVTSTQRSYAQQQGLYARYEAYKAGTGPWAPLAAKPGTSEHERGQAVDVAKSAGMTLAKLVEAFREQGVHLTEKLNEGDHFHVAWGGKGRAGPSDETLAKRAQSAQDKDTRNGEEYAQLIDRAQEEGLTLQRKMVTDKAAAAALDMQSIEIERARLDSAAQAGATERKWSQAQADALMTQNAINASLKVEAIQRDEVSRKLQETFSDSQQARDARDALMQIDLDLADTRKQRLDYERKLLADRQQSRSDAPKKIVGDPTTSPEDFAKAERGLAALPAQNDAENRQLDKRYQSPMDAYHDELTKSVGDMGDAMQGVEMDGIKGVQDGLLGILNGTKSVARGFRDMADKIIADLARIAVEKLILTFLGLKDGGEVGGSVLHLAGGGAVFGAGGPRDDRVPAMLSHGEYVVNAAAYARHPELVQAINHDRLPHFADGGVIGAANIYMRALPSMAAIARPAPAPQIIHVVTDKSALFDTHVVGLTAPMAQAAMIGGSQQAQSDMADRRMAAIP